MTTSPAWNSSIRSSWASGGPRQAKNSRPAGPPTGGERLADDDCATLRRGSTSAQRVDHPDVDPGVVAAIATVGAATAAVPAPPASDRIRSSRDAACVQRRRTGRCLFSSRVVIVFRLPDPGLRKTADAESQNTRYSRCWKAGNRVVSEVGTATPIAHAAACRSPGWLAQASTSWASSLSLDASSTVVERAGATFPRSRRRVNPPRVRRSRGSRGSSCRRRTTALARCPRCLATSRAARRPAP